MVPADEQASVRCERRGRALRGRRTHTHTHICATAEPRHPRAPSSSLRLEGGTPAVPRSWKSAFPAVPAGNFEPGAYYFLDVPEISGVEWHPFSMMNAPGEAETAFLIKTMGQQAWTGQYFPLFFATTIGHW